MSQEARKRRTLERHPASLANLAVGRWGRTQSIGSQAHGFNHCATFASYQTIDKVSTVVTIACRLNSFSPTVSHSVMNLETWRTRPHQL